MKRILLLIIVFAANATYAQLLYTNPTSLGATSGNFILQSQIAGNVGANNFYKNTWLYRVGNGGSWNTARHMDGISIDVSFQTPATTRSWWSRDPYNNYQSWGDQGNTYLSISNGNVGIGIVSPNAKLHIAAQDESTQSAISIRQENDNRFGFDIGLDQSLNGNMFLYRVFFDSRISIMEFDRANGNIGIGTSILPDAKLAVKGTIHTNEVKVDLLGAVAPDYVFEKDYPLTSLAELKTYIDQNKHLPEVPSAKEMEENGINLKEMNLVLLKKVEEMTLYIIDLEKRLQLVEKVK